jgi:hypothetical protein
MVQHMLLVSDEGGKVAHWLDSHPTLEQRVRRIYGRVMGPLPLTRDDDTVQTPEVPAAPGSGEAPGWTLV